ncbi:MAG: hypothetical protein QXP36_13360 [Conexivisphaerales archaeon]
MKVNPVEPISFPNERNSKQHCKDKKKLRNTFKDLLPKEVQEFFTKDSKTKKL